MKYLFILLLFPFLSFSQIVKNLEVEGVTIKVESSIYEDESYYDVRLGVTSCDNISFRFYNKHEDIKHEYKFSKRVSANFSILKKRGLKNWFLEVDLPDGRVLVYDINKEKVVRIKNPQY
jgi:hypothetical protein